MRLATFAVPLSGNKGSASMLLGLRDAFAKAGIEAHFEVFSYYPERDGKIAEPMSNVSIHPGHPKHIAFQLLPMIILSWILPWFVPRRWKDAIEALRQSDLVLLVGGTTFADSMVYKVPWNVLAALPGYWLGRKTVFLSQTMGPFEKWLNRAWARWTLRRAVEVHGRGRPSAENVQKLGIEHALYRPDLSFTMDVPEFQSVAQNVPLVKSLAEKIQAAHARDRLAVGVTPNSIVLSKAKKSGLDYIEFLVGVIQYIESQGHLPVLIPHSYREDIKRLHNNDRAICIEVMDRLARESDSGSTECFYVDQDLSAGELRAIVGQTDLLVASRFHSMVSALAMGVPPLTYGWGHQKYIEVLSEFDVKELYIPYIDIKLEDFPKLLDDALTHRLEFAERITNAQPTVVGEAQQLPERLAALVEKN